MKFRVGDEVIVVGVPSPIGTNPGDARVIRDIDYADPELPYLLNDGTWVSENEIQLIPVDRERIEHKNVICTTCGQPVEEDPIDLDEKVNVTMTLKQLSLIYGVIGNLSDKDAVKQAQKNELVGKYIKESDIWDELTYHLYTKLGGVLRDARMIDDEF